MDKQDYRKHAATLVDQVTPLIRMVLLKQMTAILEETHSQMTTKPAIEKEKVEGCDICGGKLVYIRGRYPGEDNREVCPTCMAETLDHIRDRLSDNYNRPQANK